MPILGPARGTVWGAIAASCLCALSACSLTRPEGDGGWSEQRRAREIERASLLSQPPVRVDSAGDVTADRAGAAIGDAARRRDDGGTDGGGAASDAAAIAASAPIDLATALDLASRHSRGMAIAAAGETMAARDVAIARAPLLPSTTVRGNYAWFSDELGNTVALPFALPGPTPTDSFTVAVREEDFGSVTAAVRLALDVSGELRHGLASAQASYRAERARRWATQLEEERAVVQAYLALLEAEGLREVAATTVELQRQQLEDADARARVGQLTRNGVLVVQVALTTSRQLLMRQELAVAHARRSLNRTIGLPVDAPTRVLDVAGAPRLPRVEDAVAAARQASPVLASLLEEIQALEERRTSLVRARFPRLGATAAYDATSAEIVQPQHYASATLGLEWDLGTDLGRESQIAKLDAASRRARLVLDRSWRDIELLVRGAHDAATERIAAAGSAAEAVEQAQENLRIRQEQFELGRATSEDLLDAESLLTRQRVTLATALYQAHARRAELQQLMGAPLADLLAPGAEAPLP
ncbi:MAG TPA: TolC family protein [Candidatus Limnocylindrales bacterium]|nr:TolC family protein [Candidatus Limnocylindrales bacterium]